LKLVATLQELIIAYFNALKLDVSDAKTLFRLIDYDHSEEIGIDEFLEGCYKLQGESRSLDMKIMQSEVHFLQEHFWKFEGDTRTILHEIQALVNSRLRGVPGQIVPVVPSEVPAVPPVVPSEALCLNGAASNGVLLTVCSSDVSVAILRGYTAVVEQPNECEELRLSTDHETLAICAQPRRISSKQSGAIASCTRTPTAERGAC
jgi:hypothetical protein